MSHTVEKETEQVHGDIMPQSLPPASSVSAATLATAPRPYACTFPGCDRRFKRKYTLNDHVKSHTGEKPFVCPVHSCRGRFTTSGNLARHRRLHPWLDAPLVCLVDGCQCTFTSETKLERHMRTHFGELGVRRCMMPNCGRVFSTGGNLRRHMRQSHDDIAAQDSDSSGSSVSGGTPSQTPRPPPRATIPHQQQHAEHNPQQYQLHHQYQCQHSSQQQQRDNSHVQEQRHQHSDEYQTGSSFDSSNPRELQSGRWTRRLPSDSELLEALACLFDEETDELGYDVSL